VAGLALVYVTVHVPTEAIDRPRPADSLVRTVGQAYPSGHSAYAVAWVAAAVVLTRRLRLVASGTLVFVALGIAAAIGVSRGYLRAHWASDVTGGWGLGAAVFALLGAIVLVVEHIRHNEDDG
jgi:undecaprenyl-diphosphatase